MNDQNNQKVSWTAEHTHPELMEPLREALKKVVDPEIGLNVVELGLIRDVVITENEPALLTMIMTTPFCPYAPALLEMTRKQAEIGLKQTTVIELGMEPWDLSMMEEGAGADWGLF
jgi:metal-sulfur cluster biosynthetic enzyme